MPENRSILYVCEDLEGKRNAKRATPFLLKSYNKSYF